MYASASGMYGSKSARRYAGVYVVWSPRTSPTMRCPLTKEAVRQLQCARQDTLSSRVACYTSSQWVDLLGTKDAGNLSVSRYYRYNSNNDTMNLESDTMIN